MGARMKKVAIFVEGETEQLFTSELIKTIFTDKTIAIEVNQFSGKMGLRKTINIRTADIDENTSFFFRIYDCHGGGENSTVKSDILEQQKELRVQAFSQIIGIRDVYPMLDAIKLKRNLKDGLPNAIPVNIILAVQEIEAWFIAEETHYERISVLLTSEIVNSVCGIDISKETTEAIPHPAEMLHYIYKKAGLAYHKEPKQRRRTINALNFHNLYLNVRKRNNSFNELASCLDTIFEEPSHA
jgi:hypothetical protein